MTDVQAQKMGLFLVFLVAIITLVFRRYFYIPLSEKKKYMKEDVRETKSKGKKKFSVIEEAEKGNDGLKIKIEKEIK